MRLGVFWRENQQGSLTDWMWAVKEREEARMISKTLANWKGGVINQDGKGYRLGVGGKQELTFGCVSLMAIGYVNEVVK